MKNKIPVGMNAYIKIEGKTFVLGGTSPVTPLSTMLF
jgi:hypothetical protein